jgi:hypothetical protein
MAKVMENEYQQNRNEKIFWKGQKKSCPWAGFTNF